MNENIYFCINEQRNIYITVFANGCFQQPEPHYGPLEQLLLEANAKELSVRAFNALGLMV